MTRTLIHSATIFDGTSTHPISTVIFNSETGLIENISEGQYVPDPSNDYAVIDGTGCTIIPGLIDAHVHVHGMDHAAGSQGEWKDLLKRPLKCGITTVCDMHCDPETVEMFRAQIKEDLEQAKRTGSGGRVTQADVKSCLLAATVEAGWPRPVVLGPNPSSELRAKVAAWPNVTESTAVDYIASQKARGADYIKLMQEDGCSIHNSLPVHEMGVATESLQRSVVEAAHAAELKVVAHALSLNNTSLVLEAGVDGLAHTFMDQKPTKEIINLYKSTGAFVVPTLAVIASATGEEPEMRKRFADIAYGKGLLNDQQKELLVASVNFATPESSIEHAYETIRQLHSAGVDIVAGTDAVLGFKGAAMGPSLWMEMNRYVQKCGLTPAEVLSSATATAARRFEFEDRGMVEKGRRADLVLVRGSPHKTLDALWADYGIVGVWKNGFRAA